MSKLDDTYNEAHKQLQGVAHLARTLKEGQISFKDGEVVFLEHMNPVRMSFIMNHTERILTASPEVGRDQRLITDIGEAFYHPMVTCGDGPKQDDFTDPLGVFMRIYKVDAPKTAELLRPLETTGHRPEFPMTEEEWEAGKAASLKK